MRPNWPKAAFISETRFSSAARGLRRKPRMKILIIGAGLSGLTAARELEKRGNQVEIVDKGRGLGGRMATRRFDDAVFDHGAQFFTARSDEFRAACAHWQSENVVAHWFDGYPSPENAKPNDKHPRFCGKTGMTGIAKHLAQGLTVHLGEEIEDLKRENGLWRAKSASGSVFEGEKLILTAPLPQSLALFDQSGEKMPAQTREMLESVSYEPCFAVLARLKSPSQIAPPGLLYVNGDPIWWLADNQQKGISPLPSVTVHSSGDWAQKHYDDDQNEVGKTLLEAAKHWIGAEIEDFQVRRWRYSKPKNPLEVGAVAVEELNLVFAGDALMGAKIEGAFLSGLAASTTTSRHSEGA